jgi:hypothetical protein
MFTYDPSKVSFSWNGIRVYGWAPDSMIEVERDDDSFKKQVGAQGDPVRIASLNRGGKIKIRLLKESPVNKQLSAALIADENGLGAPGAAFLRDFNSDETFVESTECWLMKPATMEYSADGGVREWTFDCADLNMVDAGQ